jgi:type II secretory pathway component GspD/PulD (secretin)
MRSSKYMLLTLALVLAFVSASFAQQPAPGPVPSPEPNQADRPTERSFKSKVFEIKYRDPNSLVNAVINLGSGVRGSTMSANGEFRTITVRDFPENIATVEEALKRLDVPAAPRPNIELHMHVLIASNTSATATDVPADLKEVLAQLRGTLNYKNYELVASIVQRLTETPRGLQGSGIAELPSTNPGTPVSYIPYEYHINNISLVQNATGAASVQIAEFTFVTVENNRARVQTALNLRDGEKVVVGTATIRNRALVIVLTAKLIK